MSGQAQEKTAQRGPDEPQPPAPRRRSRRGRFFGAVGVSLAAHAVILLAVLSMGTYPPRPPLPEPVVVSLMEAPVEIPKPAPPAPPAAAPAADPQPAPTPKPKRTIVRRTPAPSRPVETLPADDDAGPADPGPGLSDAQLAGAATAGSGGGGVCDMPRRLQDALEKDPLVRSAVASLAGKAVWIWNGDWVWIQGEDGKGLTAVRQAVMWEIAFAPKACRSVPVHGLVVLSVRGVDGPARLALGAGDWRWSDLLIPHPGPSGEP